MHRRAQEQALVDSYNRFYGGERAPLPAGVAGEASGQLEPLRGEVWNAHIPGAGVHPVVVLTINPLMSRLSWVTVVVVTGAEGPAATHVPLGREAGLTKYDVGFANVTDIHTIAQSKLARRRGALHPAEMARTEEALRLTLGL